MKLLSLAGFFATVANACDLPSESCHCFPFASNYLVTTNYDFFGDTAQTQTSWRFKSLVKSDFDFDKKPP